MIRLVPKYQDPINADDEPIWSVTTTSADGSSDTFETPSCELAVEFALLVAELEKWRGQPGTIVLDDGKYDTVQRRSLVNARRKRPVRYD